MSAQDGKGKYRFTFEDLGNLSDNAAAKKHLEKHCAGEPATARLKESLEKCIQGLVEEVQARFINENDRLVLQVIAGKENRAQDRPAIEALAELVRYLGKCKIRGEKELEKAANQEVSEYELSIQQLEARIREQIGMEQQLRLYVEDAKERIVDLERKNRRATDVEFELSRQNAKLKQRIETLEKELTKKKEERAEPSTKLASAAQSKRQEPGTSRPLQKHLASTSANHFHFNFNKKHPQREPDKEQKAVREQNWFDQPSIKKPLTLYSRSGLADTSNFSALLKKVTTALLSKDKLLAREKSSAKGQSNIKKHKSSSGAGSANASLSGLGSSRTAEHILELSGFSVDGRKPKTARSKRQRLPNDYGEIVSAVGRKLDKLIDKE